MSLIPSSTPPPAPPEVAVITAVVTAVAAAAVCVVKYDNPPSALDATEYRVDGEDLPNGALA